MNHSPRTVKTATATSLTRSQISTNIRSHISVSLLRTERERETPNTQTSVSQKKKKNNYNNRKGMIFDHFSHLSQSQYFDFSFENMITHWEIFWNFVVFWSNLIQILTTHWLKLIFVNGFSFLVRTMAILGGFFVCLFFFTTCAFRNWSLRVIVLVEGLEFMLEPIINRGGPRHFGA